MRPRRARLGEGSPEPRVSFQLLPGCPRRVRASETPPGPRLDAAPGARGRTARAAERCPVRVVAEGSAIPGTAARGLPCPWDSPGNKTVPSPGDLPDPGIQPRSPALQADSFFLAPNHFGPGLLGAVGPTGQFQACSPTVRAGGFLKASAVVQHSVLDVRTFSSYRYIHQPIYTHMCTHF